MRQRVSLFARPPSPSFTHHRREQEVVRQELHLGDLDMIPKLVHFESVFVVDIDVLLLRNGEEALVVKPADRSCRLLELDLGVEATGMPVESSDMSLATGDCEMAGRKEGENQPRRHLRREKAKLRTHRPFLV